MGSGAERRYIPRRRAAPFSCVATALSRARRLAPTRSRAPRAVGAARPLRNNERDGGLERGERRTRFGRRCWGRRTEFASESEGALLRQPADDRTPDDAMPKAGPFRRSRADQPRAQITIRRRSAERKAAEGGRGGRAFLFVCGAWARCRRHLASGGVCMCLCWLLEQLTISLRRGRGEIMAPRPSLIKQRWRGTLTARDLRRWLS